MIELLCVIAIIAILAALLLPVLGQGQARARRLECVNNLKETGTAFHAYSHDHNGRFPMEVPAAEGGSLEYVQNGYRVTGEFYFSFRHFQPLSNDLVTPKLLLCPTETARLPALRFAGLRNDNLSYFVGVTSTFDKPDSILAGDRNITNDFAHNPSIVHSRPAYPVRWTRELHRFKGNLLFADGHAAQANDASWAEAHTAVNGDLFLPTLQPPNVVADLPVVRPQPEPAERTPAPTRPAVVNGNASGKGGSSLLMLAHARGNGSAAAQPPTVKPETNSMAPVASPATNRPAALPAPAAADTPFMQMLADVSAAIRVPLWLLYLLLFLMVAVLMTLLLRRRPR